MAEKTIDQLIAEAERRISTAKGIESISLEFGTSNMKRLIGEIERLRKDAARYQWLRARDLDAIDTGGVFAGMTPQNVILNGDDLDGAIDAAIASGGN